MQQLAADFRDESEALHALLRGRDPGDWGRRTQFKDWSVRDVVGHLHMWNVAADLSLTDEPRFLAWLEVLKPKIAVAGGMRGYTEDWLGTRDGAELLAEWRSGYLETAEHFAAADPKQRLKWAGPEMSARSAVTARLMETWAHGQEIYDLFGVERVDHDRIRNVAHLGVSTFGWTFANRGLGVPEPAPYVRLTAPSGAAWEWNAPQSDNAVEGDAAEFCQVVAQVRNVADTSLVTRGETARRWMAIAQCFAGPPEDPPAPGTRYRNMQS
jgi:uncharacterized protein (TIGR03084 family)